MRGVQHAPEHLIGLIGVGHRISAYLRLRRRGRAGIYGLRQNCHLLGAGRAWDRGASCPSEKLSRPWQYAFPNLVSEESRQPQKAHEGRTGADSCAGSRAPFARPGSGIAPPERMGGSFAVPGHRLGRGRCLRNLKPEDRICLRFEGYDDGRTRGRRSRAAYNARGYGCGLLDASKCRRAIWKIRRAGSRASQSSLPSHS